MRVVDSKEGEWVVLLEAADERCLSTIEPQGFHRLVDSWAVPTPTTLYSPNRYALQTTVRAADPPAALALAVSLWQDAVRRSGVPAWDLVRAEIMTPGELEKELGAAGGPGTFGAPASERLVGDELLRRALHDGVTGLPDREMFLDEVRRTLLTAVAHRAVRAVVAVAVDAGGRSGAPTQGRDADELSAVVARHLTAAVRRGDTVARVGTAEFAALVTLPGLDHADRLAERMVRSARTAGERLGRQLTASVGVAVASSTDDDPDDLVVTAELAMVAAQQAGGDRHVHFGLVGNRSRRDAAS